jgi:glyoxylase-like metal-dependent hydrolase (beta-lactamase superfamily II)
VTRDLPAGDNDDLRWMANSATLMYGDDDAVLVDSFATIEQNSRLVAWVKADGCNLTHVFLTQGHGDRTYGIGQLLQAFPKAQAVATAATAAETRREAGDEFREGFFGRIFPGQVPQPVIPTELTDDTILLEGHNPGRNLVDIVHRDEYSGHCPLLDRHREAPRWPALPP